MIATMDSATNYPATWYFDSCGSYPDEVQIQPVNTKVLLQILNAIKAMETVLQITKAFNHTIKKTFYPITRIIYLRMLFCLSGYLPKRIRRIRKSK